MEEFRRALYEGGLDRRGRLRPSEASDIPQGEQEVCPHAYEDLKWGANGSAHWADCKKCRLRKVLYYSHMHGAMMVEREKEEANLLLKDREVILGTGCRTAVAGASWHRRFQTMLKQQGLGWSTVEHEEVFRFGAGRPVLSTEAHLYPVQVGGMLSWLRLAVVESTKDSRVDDCPALVGPSELARWNVKMDFAKQGISVNDGQWCPLKLSASRHPVLSILPAPELSVEAWGTPELWKLRERLIFDPYSMALLQEVLEQVAEEKPDSETDEEEPTELQEVGDESFVTAAASWQEMMEDEAISKWDELALPPSAFKEIMTTEIDSSQEGSVYSNDTSSGNETTSGNETGDEACMEEVEESGSESSESEEEEWSMGGGHLGGRFWQRQ